MKWASGSIVERRGKRGKGSRPEEVYMLKYDTSFGNMMQCSLRTRKQMTYTHWPDPPGQGISWTTHRVNTVVQACGYTFLKRIIRHYTAWLLFVGSLVTCLWRPLKTTAKAPCPIRSPLLYSYSATDCISKTSSLVTGNGAFDQQNSLYCTRQVKGLAVH